MKKGIMKVNGQHYSESYYNKRKINFGRLSYILGVLLIICLLPVTGVHAASGLALYNYQTKQTVSYTGQQVTYACNGKTIPSKNTPGIIIDGTSLAPFMEVFVKSEMHIKYKLEEKNGKLTLTKGKTVIVMTLGSKTVFVNGKKVTAPLAPVKMKYIGQKVSKILVPVRFVAETFGYSYQWDSKTSIASMKDALNLNYNNKNITYAGTKGKVTVENRPVQLNSIPVIIVDDTALLPAWQVFAKSSIKAGYSYDKGSKKVTLTKGDVSIEMTIGSKTAYVNGAVKRMDTAPLYVTNRSSQEACVMVPGSFVATTLGYGYSWNGGTKTSQITAGVTKNGDDKTGENNTGGNPTDTHTEPGRIVPPDTTLFKWEILPELSENYNIASQVITTAEVSEERDSLSTIDSINLTKGFNAADGKEIYTIQAASPIGKTTIKTEGNLLKLHINNSYVNIAPYNPGGFLAGEVSTFFNALDNSSEISMYLSDAKAKYQVTLSEDQCALIITLYPNYINEVTAGRKDGKEYLTVSTVNKMSVTLTENGSSLILQFPYTVNGVGDKISGSSLEAINTVTSAKINDYMSVITLKRASIADYRVEQTETSYTIYFTGDSTNNEENTGDSKSSLQFRLPEGIFYNDITTEDRYRYYQNQIAILLPGNYEDFYAENPVTANSEVVQDVSVSYINNFTEIVIDTKKLQGFRLSETTNGVNVILGNPRDIYQNIVLLDPGHGGNATGATATLNGVKILEKNLNLAILYTRAQKYFNAPDSKIKVYYTRYGDEVRYSNIDTENYDRAAQAKRIGADLYVSLHMNSYNGQTPSGTEVYYNSSNNAPVESGLTSKLLAKMFLDSLTANMGTVNRGVKDKSLVVTRENTVPAVLIELGFISNQQELANLNDDAFQEKAAKTIYDTLCEVFETYPTGR